jgi:hypothetical protein
MVSCRERIRSVERVIVMCVQFFTFRYGFTINRPWRGSRGYSLAWNTKIWFDTCPVNLAFFLGGGVNVHWDRYLSEYFCHSLSVLFHQYSLIFPLSPTVVILKMTTFYKSSPPSLSPGDSLYWARGFTINLRHTTLGRIHLDEWSSHCRDLYLTTHNTLRSILTLLGSGHQKPAWNLPVTNVQYKTSDDGHRRCPKHVEFYKRINLGN